MTRVLLLAIAVSAGVLAGVTASAGDARHFCCESTGDDGHGRDVGYGCERIHEDDADRCKSEVLECSGSWTKDHGTVTCY